MKGGKNVFVFTVPSTEKDNNKYLDSCIFGTAEKREEAFGELYGMTKVSVYSYAFSILKNRYDAEDAMHDCYLKIYASAPSYVSEGKPLAWILTITRNLCLQKLRETSKLTQTAEESDFDSLFTDKNITSDEKILIEGCLKELSDTEREIVILHAVSGLKHREIAEQLDMPLPTVLSKYSRAIKKLRNMLKEEDNSNV